MTDERLSQFLREGKNWERKATSISGVFLIKLPEYKSRPPYIAMEINPVDSTGAATKKRGILIKSSSELEQISNILTNAKIVHLATSLDEVNPEKKSKHPNQLKQTYLKFEYQAIDIKKNRAKSKPIQFVKLLLQNSCLRIIQMSISGLE